MSVTAAPARRPSRFLLAVLAACLVGAACIVGAACGGGDGGGGSSDPAGGSGAEAPVGWPTLGRDLANSRAVEGGGVDRSAAASLAVAWETPNLVGVSGTPIVDGGTVYLGDWTGHVRALDAASGTEEWARDLGTSYVGGAVALDRDRVYAGTFDARIVALDRGSGEPMWEAEVDEHPQAVVFGSPVVVEGLVVAGVGSYEVFAGGESPSFRGSVVALDAATGEEAWRTWTTAGDEREGPGVSVWSSPAVDVERGHVYIGTGQAYAPPAPSRSDALLALDLRTGEEVWVRQFTTGDAWTLARPTGLDADVGAPPNLFSVSGTPAVGVGDKAGTYHAVDRSTGEVLWSRRVTPGGLQGGIMASAAVADGHVYVASNDASTDADLVALDLADGAEAWRAPVGAHVTGPVTWADGVVYLADDSGRIAAHDDRTGRRLWSHTVAAPAAGGITVVDGTVYAGFGWWLASPPPDPQGGLVAFRPPGSSSRPSSSPPPSSPPPSPPSDASGEQVHAESCASCHGGSGEGASGPSLEGVADRLTRDDHLAVVRDGRGAMPAWEGRLTEYEIEAVVDHQRDVLSDGG